MEQQKVFHLGAIASLAILIAWLVAWETLVAPLHPGGSFLALKAVPLLIPLGGVIKRDIYTLQWSSMLILLYFTEGVVRAWSDTVALSRYMAMGETALVCIYFLCALLYLRPYKKAAKKLAKELLDKVKAAKNEC
ncbi:MAG: DUF2069 domain-containing protein [Pseudomonadota bacterium]|nr:DUF2069 domain-containing protein [Pseudomonadota bacterium]